MEQKTCGKIVAIKILSILTYVVIGLCAVCVIAALIDPNLLKEAGQETQQITTAMLIVTLVCLAIPLIIGILANKKIKTAENKSQLMVLSIIALLFFDVIVGILMLCLTDEELKEYQGRK